VPHFSFVVVRPADLQTVDTTSHKAKIILSLSVSPYASSIVSNCKSYSRLTFLSISLCLLGQLDLSTELTSIKRNPGHSRKAPSWSTDSSILVATEEFSSKISAVHPSRVDCSFQAHFISSHLGRGKIPHRRYSKHSINSNHLVDMFDVSDSQIVYHVLQVNEYLFGFYFLLLSLQSQYQNLKNQHNWILSIKDPAYTVAACSWWSSLIFGPLLQSVMVLIEGAFEV